MARRSVVIDLEVRNQQARASLEGIEGGFTNLRQSIDDPMAVRFDVDRARTSLQGIESGVTSLRQSTQQASSIARQSTGAMASGFNRASVRVGQSQNAVMNLSRIVEDAPFGIRGVANNINPFIESFQRLQTQTGSTSAAMSSLLSSAFTGPGALLTISALVTSAITAIQMGLLDIGGEAEDTLEEIDDLLGSFERTIELQDQFGAFEDDEFGIAETQAQIREITEDIQEQRGHIEYINSLEEERRQIRQQAAAGEQIDTERLQEINTILERELSIEEVEEEINSLQEERLQLSVDLANTADAIADEDTQQAQQQQRAREEQEKRTEAAQAELEAARALNRARREMAEESQVEDELMGPADIDTDLELGASDAPIGSIRDLRDQLQGLKTDYEDAFTDAERERIKSDMEAIQDEIEGMEGGLDGVGNSGEQSMKALEDAAGGVVGMLIRGKEEALSFESILSSILPAVANVLFPGGGFLPGLARGLFSGFAHGTDMGFPGIGRVGERGEELLVAPPMSSVITNENVERMDRWRNEARQGASNISAMGGNQMEGAVMNAFSKLNLNAETRTEARDLVTMIRMELDQQGGKGGNGSI